MGQYVKYKCDICGYEHVHDLEIFWIDENYEINVSMLLFSTSEEMAKSLGSGYYHEYFCYDCNEIVKEFLISENPSNMNHEDIIHLIESYDNGPKIIKFDNKFQKCLTCSRSLELRSDKAFSLDKKGNFNIEDMILHDYLNDDEYEFWGVYYGYYCKDCKRQINKFVVMQNYGDLDEDSIRNILLKHTNDLTVLLFDYKVACPECEGNLYTLGESSPCPRCHEGKLRLNESLMVD